MSDYTPVTVAVFEDGSHKFVRRDDVDTDLMKLRVYRGGGEWAFYRIAHIEYHTTNNTLYAYTNNTPTHTVIHLDTTD